MIKYLSNIKKPIAAFVLVWTVFLNLIPGAALAYKIYTINGENYWVYESYESGSTAPGKHSIFLQPGQQFNPDTGTVTDKQTGEVISQPVAGMNNTTTPPASTAAPSAATGSQTGSITINEETGKAYYQNAEGALVEIPRAEAAGAQGIGEGQAAEGSPDAGSLAEQTVTSLGTCSIGAILGRLLSSLIGQMVNAILNFITNTLLGIVSGALDCALRPFQVCDTNPAAENQLSSIGEKETGESVRTVTGLAKFFRGISLDSIMFCIINEILIYITQSTIEWINNGFEGNPVFIQNPQALFQRIAAQEAGNFIYTTANGVQNAVDSGVHQSLGAVSNEAARLTGQLGNTVTRGLVSQYNNDGLSGNYYLPPPTMSYDRVQNPQGFTDRMSQYDPRNTAFGRMAFYEGPTMNNYVYEQQRIAALKYQTQGGYYDNTACPEGQQREFDGTCNPRALLTTVQGGQIKDELNGRNLTKYLRVATANSFDAIVTALVNQLMKIAINKIYETEAKVNNSIQGATQRTGGR